MLPLPVGWTKVNVDGSFIGQTGAAGIGANGQEFFGPDLIYGLASTSVPECRRSRSDGVGGR